MSISMHLISILFATLLLSVSAPPTVQQLPSIPLKTLTGEDVDLQSSYVPAEFNGTLSGHEEPGRLTLALALNGKIAGIAGYSGGF